MRNACFGLCVVLFFAFSLFSGGQLRRVNRDADNEPWLGSTLEVLDQAENNGRDCQDHTNNSKDNT